MALGTLNNGHLTGRLLTGKVLTDGTHQRRLPFWVSLTCAQVDCHSLNSSNSKPRSGVLCCGRNQHDSRSVHADQPGIDKLSKLIKLPLSGLTAT